MMRLSIETTSFFSVAVAWAACNSNFRSKMVSRRRELFDDADTQERFDTELAYLVHFQEIAVWKS